MSYKEEAVTIIDHQQAATVAAAKALFVMQHRVAVEKFELNSYAALSEAATREASNALQAATPHLRAAWAEKIRVIDFSDQEWQASITEYQAARGDDDIPDDWDQAFWEAGYKDGIAAAAALLEGGAE